MDLKKSFRENKKILSLLLSFNERERSERKKTKLRYIYNATRNGINKIFRVSRYYENFHKIY